MKINNTIIAFLVILFFCSGSYASNSSTTPIYSEDVIEQTISSDDWHFYSIEVDTATKLTIKLRKISDDVDLYVARSKKPTNDDFLCAPQKSGTLIETCRLTSHTPSTWYIGVHGKMQSDYRLAVKTDP